MGTYFSPRVPEASPHLEMSLGIRDLWGSLAPVSSWESLGSMYSRWGTMGACLPSPPRLFGEPVFLPGFLGVPKTSQSWAISLPREGAVSKAAREGMFLALPPLSYGGVFPEALWDEAGVSELSSPRGSGIPLS